MNTTKLKQAGLRLAKVVAAAVVAAVASFVAGPEVAGLVGTQVALILVALLTPVFSAVEKFLTGPTVKA